MSSNTPFEQLDFLGQIRHILSDYENLTDEDKDDHMLLRVSAAVSHEYLRKAFHEIVRLENERMPAIVNRVNEIRRLTNEVDRLRRLYCHAQAATIQGQSPQMMAASLGWDCFHCRFCTVEDRYTIDGMCHSCRREHGE